MNGIPTIAWLTLHESLRRRVLLVALILGLAFLLIFAAGFYAIMSSANAGNVRNLPSAPQRLVAPAFLTMAGFYAVNFMVILMAVLMPVDTLSGEISSGAIQSLVTKPIRRSDVVLGKWLGFWLILMAYLLLMCGGVILIALLAAGFVAPDLALGIPLLMLEGTLLLSLSIAGGTRLSTLTNGVMVFGLYGLAFIGGWVEQVSALLGNSAGSYLGILSSLLIPSEALWHLAAYHMQPPLIRDLGISPFSSASVPSDVMVLWAIGYIVVVMLFALTQFRARDL